MSSHEKLPPQLDIQGDDKSYHDGLSVMNTGHAKARTFDPSTHLIAPYPQGSFRLYDDNSYHYKEIMLQLG